MHLYESVCFWGFGTELKLKNNGVLEYVRACPYCSRVFIEKNLFCKRCWRMFVQSKSSIENIRRRHYPFKAYSLFVWDENRPHLSCLFYTMKGGQFRSLADILGLWFVRDLKLLKQNWKEDYQQPILVPAPGSTSGSRDHAGLLAEIFSYYTGWEIREVLARPGLEKQKERGRKERLRQETALKSDISDLEGRKIIFVDDIITTGGTALSAYNALGKPLSFEVWTLGCRPKQDLL